MEPESERHSAGEVIERMKKALHCRNDSDLASVLNVAQTTVSSWRNRGSVPYEQCVQIALNTHTNLEWLLLGRGWQGEDKYPKGQVDLNLLRKVVEGFERRSQNFDVTMPPDIKARWIVSLYKFWAAHLDELLATGKHTREEALELIEKLAPEADRLAWPDTED
jgi:hypothetical protein